jgi:hypothetical protein
VGDCYVLRAVRRSGNCHWHQEVGPVKHAHLVKVEERAKKALELLLPWETPRGEVEDPKKRLRQLIVRVDGERRDELANDVWAVTELLEHDVPELIKAVRDAQEDARQARKELSQRAGTRYTVTLSSDAPIGVLHEVIVPGEGIEPGQEVLTEVDGTEPPEGDDLDGPGDGPDRAR